MIERAIYAAPSALVLVAALVIAVFGIWTTFRSKGDHVRDRGPG